MTTAQPEASPASPPPGHLARLRPGNLRAADVRVFSSASDAPRARRPTDVVLLVLAIPSSPRSRSRRRDPVVRSATSILSSPPRPHRVALGHLLRPAVRLDAVRTHGIAGRSCTQTPAVRQLLAGALAYLIAMAAGEATGSACPTDSEASPRPNLPAVYPAMRLAVAAAIIVATSPHLSRPLRMRAVGRNGRAVASIALGIALPIGVIAGLAVGFAAAAIVHLLLGSPGGRLLPAPGRASTRRARDRRDRSAVRAAGAQWGLARPGHRSRQRIAAGEDLQPDAWDGQFLTSDLVLAVEPGQTPQFGGRLHQVEHEAFVTLLAEAPGRVDMPVVAADMAAAGTRSSWSTPRRATVGPLDPHGRRCRAHAHLGNGCPLVRPPDRARSPGRVPGRGHADGTPAVGDLSQATISAADAALRADRAQLLVSTALARRSPAGGRRRPVRPRCRRDRRDAPLPATGGARSPTRHAVRAQDWDLDDLRKLAADAAGVELPSSSRSGGSAWARSSCSQ